MGRRRPDAAPAAQGGQIGANGGHQRLQRVRISLEPVCWALFVPNRLTAAETRKRFLTARAHSGFRHFSSRLLVLRPGRAATATGGGFGRRGRWLAGRHRCGAGAVGYRLAGARLAADWPSPVASRPAAGGGGAECDAGRQVPDEYLKKFRYSSGTRCRVLSYINC